MAVALEDPTAVERALSEWVATRLAADGSPPREPVQVELHGAPASGNSNVTVPLTARWDGMTEELVLRMQTTTNQIFLDADVLREARVLDGLTFGSAVPAPRVRWTESDPAILGHPFFLMERLPGTVPHGMPSIHVDGWLPGLTPEQRVVLWRSAMDALASVHRVDWRAQHAFLADAPNGTTLAQRMEHLTRWYDWACAGRAFPVTDAGLEYLRDALPELESAPTVLCWGDPRVGNMIFADDGRCVGILDWELASLAPAALDLGWWCVMEEFQTVAHGIDPLPGWPDRDTTVAHYEAITSTRVPDLLWYEVLAAWVLTVTVIRMADIGVARGTLAPTTNMGHGNLTAQMVAHRLGLPVPALDPDYARRRGLA